MDLAGAVAGIVAFLERVVTDEHRSEVEGRGAVGQRRRRLRGGRWLTEAYAGRPYGAVLRLCGVAAAGWAGLRLRAERSGHGRLSAMNLRLACSWVREQMIARFQHIASSWSARSGRRRRTPCTRRRWRKVDDRWTRSRWRAGLVGTGWVAAMGGEMAEAWTWRSQRRSSRSAPMSNFESELVAAVAGIGEQDITVAADTSAAEAAIESVPDGEADLTVNTDQAEQGLVGRGQGQDRRDDVLDQHPRRRSTGRLSGMGGLGGAAGGAASALRLLRRGWRCGGGGLFTFAQAGLRSQAPRSSTLIAGPIARPARLDRRGRPLRDIGRVGLQLGSSDEAMLNATASFVSFAQSTGAGDDQIVTASDNINALALRCRAEPGPRQRRR